MTLAVANRSQQFINVWRAVLTAADVDDNVMSYFTQQTTRVITMITSAAIIMPTMLLMQRNPMITITAYRA